MELYLCTSLSGTHPAAYGLWAIRERLILKIGDRFSYSPNPHPHPFYLYREPAPTPPLHPYPTPS